MSVNFRVYFRAFELDDFETSFFWRQDELIWESVVGRRYYVSKDYERKWVEKRVYGLPNSEAFAICMRGTSQYIGNAYLNDIDFFNRSCSVGLIIGDASSRGKGLGQEVILLLLKHAFLELGLERVGARQLTSNTASIKAHKRAGFQIEGVARKAAMKGGKLVDLNLMSCLRDDFLLLWEQLRNS